MSDDPLGKFRRKGEPSDRGALQEPEGDDRVYAAFVGKDKHRGRVTIRCKNGRAHAIAYSYIIEVIYDWRRYNTIALVLGTMLIRIDGRNLRPIVDALNLGVCQFIQEFSSEEYDPPERSDKPYVSSIVVTSSAELQEELRNARKEKASQ